MINSKIRKLSELKKIVMRLKSKGKKIVFTNGCFDILHYGHVKYLEDTKVWGDILVVGVNSDSSVRKLKGSPRPITNQLDRARIIASLESVDYVAIFGENTPLNIIKTLRPDVLIKGGDWKKADIVGSSFVESYSGKTKTIPFVKGYSTTDILRKIAKKF